MRWQEAAACRDVDLSVFFPDVGEHSREAHRFCSVCPVRVECLDHAVTAPELFGIWGDKSPSERRAIRVRRKKAA